MTQLAELAKKEQLKVARNVYELASYYSPMQHVADLMDFQHMYARVQQMKEDNLARTIKQLWPQASDAFNDKLTTRAKWLLENQNNAKALLATLPKAEQTGLSTEEMFEYAFSQTRIGQAALAEAKTA